MIDGLSYGAFAPSIEMRRMTAEKPFVSRATPWIAEQVAAKAAARRYWAAAESCPDGPEQDKFMNLAVSAEQTVKAIERKLRSIGY